MDLGFFEDFTLKKFFIYFCIAYTIFDIAGSVDAVLNHTGGGITHDPINTNTPVRVELSVRAIN